ncbi:MAG TPA: UDP-N-acetylglucosamine 1-carboxyvinyltransferase [Thermoleophilaceae bacterium]|jgi:UDP-N-acetylglucosamine 1-carboxyvinyltransferase|nr:UDP-N-acetylglucosamine 1-carboxyvinyltransferase [Thermoleophilaceae bacterium]
MEKFVIEGGVPLCGTIRPAGNKNAALPLLASSLLTDEQVVLHNVPQIRDVEAMLALLADLGVEVERRDGSTVALKAANIRTTQADSVLAERIRASVLVGGPLLARCGDALLPPPGGDVIGRRRLDPHLDAFRALGATVEHGRDIRLSAPNGGLVACDFFMDEPSVMGTENALMAAALTPGTTIIRNAASEPHVQDLARMLNRMGAAITGIGSNVMEVHGADRLGGCEHTVSPDHIEIASFMALAGVTGGELRIESCVADDLRMIRLVFARLGLHSDFDGDDCVVPGDQKLVMARDHGGYQIKVEDGPWPAFPADLTSIAVALATQSEGTVLLFEKMFENRLIFTDKLVLMGANVILCDPHRAVISGPARLHGARLESPDIRAGMAMLIAALCADGVSEIGNIVQIDRGYERIDERLRALGARIERVVT